MFRFRSAARAVAASLLALSMASGAVAHAAPTAPTGPTLGEVGTFPEAYLASLAHPGAMPPGVNDWSCKGTAKHPNPVVLVHGTWDSAYGTWPRLSAALKRDGYCLFAFNYGAAQASVKGGAIGQLPGVYGVGDLRESDKEVATFIDKVYAATGRKVDLVGHSQGQLHQRAYVQDYGGATKVRNIVSIAGDNQGTTFFGTASMGDVLQSWGIPALTIAKIFLGSSGPQQSSGGKYTQWLNRNGFTVPGIRYTNIGTQYDTIVTPWTNAFMVVSPTPAVRNWKVQDYCSDDRSDHLSATFSPTVIWMTQSALDDSYAKSHPVADACETAVPFIGGVGQ